MSEALCYGQHHRGRAWNVQVGVVAGSGNNEDSEIGGNSGFASGRYLEGV